MVYKRQGAGRPATGRKMVHLFVTKREAHVLRNVLEQFRGKLKNEESTFDPVQCSSCGSKLIVNSSVERCPFCGCLGEMEYIIRNQAPGSTEGSFMSFQKAKEMFPDLPVYDGEGDYSKKICD